jgi:16S rRNA (cytosine1402-N4)-methyltransferase
MTAEILEQLRPRPGQTILDGTGGGGGHAAAILGRIRPGGLLLLLDCDHEACERLIARFGRVGDIRYFCANFADLDEVLAQAGLALIDGALLDLGASSLQLGDPARGFSFERAGPLDMRMDRDRRLTASQIVNRWAEDRLAAALRDYGDEPMSRRMARAIVAARRRGPIRRTDQLAEILSSAVPPAWRRRRIHPATRAFMALRIIVNEEFVNINTFFDKVFRHLRPGGRLAVLTFHSGEDRIVKARLRQAVREGLVSLPVAKPVTPSRQEIARNPRSRSAKLRICERLPAAG